MYGGYSYIDLEYIPEKEDIIVLFWIKGKGKIEKLGEAVASESSVGTWTSLNTMNKFVWENLRARIFRIDKVNENAGFVWIAYPYEHFEEGNLLQFFASVMGNLFGIKELEEVRVLDISFPIKFQKNYKGPIFGIKGVRKRFGTKDRPHIGTIIKPKVGLTPKEFAEVSYKAYKGGIDFIKDDENLVNQKFCPFKNRFDEMMKTIEKIEREEGRKIGYSPNVTGPYSQMMERIDYVLERGWDIIMLDVFVIGLGALEDIINYLRKKKVLIHAHRAGHAINRGRFGINFYVFEKMWRMVGVDQLHVGTGVGKMEGTPQLIQRMNHIISKNKIEEDLSLLSLKQEWDLKPVMPVASGGLHAGMVEALVEIHGRDVVIQAGGGVHGHPLGTEAGAKSMRQAIEALEKGQSLLEYAKSHKELKLALEKWGYVDPNKIKKKLEFWNNNKETIKEYVLKEGYDAWEKVIKI